VFETKTMTIQYQYTQRKLFTEKPYHYHYSDYEDKALLIGFIVNRQEALNVLEKNNETVKRVQHWCQDCANASDAFSYRDWMNLPFKSEPILLQVVNWVLDGGNVSDPVYLRFVTTLIKRFEVSKRIRKKYKPDFRLQNRENASLDAYAHLSFLISALPPEIDSLWKLNVLLKVNDLLLSAEIGELSDLSQAILYWSVEQELNEISCLMSQKGVEL
jgi:hypothetical protein